MGNFPNFDWNMPSSSYHGHAKFIFVLFVDLKSFIAKYM